MNKLISLVLIFLVLQACGDNSTSTGTENISNELDLKNNIIIDEFELYITKTKLDRLKNQLSAFFVSNLSNSTDTYRFSTTCQLGIILKKRDAILVDSRKKLECDSIETGFKLERGESKKFTIDFDKGEFGSIFPDNSDLNPGLYTLTVFLLEDQSPQVSLSFILE